MFAALLLAIFSTTALAAAASDEDTDTRMIDAKVVEVADNHISVIARSGVEHVIAIDGSDTKVKIEGRLVSLKDVREGDVVTVELDARKQLKFARNIVIAVQANSSEVATARP
jgi:hypothetical protein